MHHHRLVLNGAPAAVARLADDLRAAGAVALGGAADVPVRLVWATPRASAVEALCARHRSVVVGLERFESLGGEFERLVLQGRDATLLERRPLPRAAEHAEELRPADLGGLCLDDDAAPLEGAAVRVAARRVAATPVPCGPVPASSALDDALLLGPVVGRLCAAAGDPLAEDAPPAAALDAVATLAATALTIGAMSAGSVCAAELEFERAWRLTQASADAGCEPMWARPGDADWPRWLMELLGRAAAVIESCAACLHQPPQPFVSLHTEHFDTIEEELDRVAGELVAGALQTLVLFDDGGAS